MWKPYSRRCLVAIGLAVLGPWAVLADQAPLVIQKHKAFSVNALSVSRGETIRFTNADPYPHQLYTKGKGIDVDSDLQQPGQDIDITFPESGTFEVRCGVHPRMLLTVTVH